MAGTIQTQCAGCRVVFTQLDDPGRRRQYHDAACKQRAYRERAKAAKQPAEPSRPGSWADRGRSVQ